jgi:zinc protease
MAGAGGSAAGTVAIQLWILAGTADERAREHGCAHLLEHMLFKPLEVDGHRLDIASAIEALGGDVNAFTSHDETVFHATVPAKQFGPALLALVDPIARAVPSATDLEQESEVVLEEIRQYDDDPSARATQEMLEHLYGAHAYARPVLGKAPEIAATRASTLRGFLRRNYRGERVALVVVGPIPAAKVLATARPILAGFSGPRAGSRPKLPRPARVPAVRDEPSVIVLREDVSEAHLSLGWPAPAWPDAEACALEVAANALGWGESSWIARNLRRRDGLVTDGHAALFAGRQASTFVVSAHSPSARIEAASRAIVDLVGRLRDVALDDEELARGRAVLESDVVYRRETVHGQAHALGYYLSLRGDIELDRIYLERLGALRAADVRDACMRRLEPRRAALALVVPKDAFTAVEARAMAKRLSAVLAGAPRKRRKPSARVRVDKHGFALAELASGVRVRMAIDRTLPMLAGWIVWPGGQRTEPARYAGASALTAALLTRGSHERDGDTLAREIEGRAAVLDGLAARSSMGMHLECLARDGETVLRRALECAMGPALADVEVDRERRIALDELVAERDDLATLAYHAASAKLYGSHPYGRRRRGTAESLKNLTSGDLRRMWREGYPIGRACVGLCGDFDPHAMVELLDAVIGRLDPPPALERLPGRAPKRPDCTPVRIHRAREQAHIVLAWPGIVIGDPRSPTLEVLTTILGGQAGRLFAALREEEGLVYQVSASSSEGIDAGHVSFYAAASQDKLARARSALERERKRICDEPPTPDELERARAWILGQSDAALQRRSRVSSLLAFNEMYGLGYEEHLRHAAKIRAVDARAVQALACELFRADRQVTAIVAGKSRA